LNINLALENEDNQELKLSVEDEDEYDIANVQ
jgi:hypothetical protein